MRQLLGHEAGLPVVDERARPAHPRGLRPAGGGDRAAAPGVAARHPARLPRREPRLVRGRADAARGPGGPHARPLLRRGDRRAARARGLLRRPGRPAEASGSPGSSAIPAWKALPQMRDLPRPMALAMTEPALAVVPDVRQPAAAPPRGPRPRRVPPARVPGRAARSARRATSPAPTRRSSARSARAGHHGRDACEELTRFPRPPTAAGTTRCSRWRPRSRSASPARSASSGSARATAPSATRARAAPSRSPTRTAGVSFAYVMNRLGFHLSDDPREKALRDALYRCLGST